MTGNIDLAVIGIVVMLVLLALRIPIAIAMLLVGIVGYVEVSGWLPLINHFNNAVYSRFASYELSVVPLFLLMGQFATMAGMSTGLFDAASKWLGHRRGGIAMAAVGSCAGFGAICGSSLATAATMGQVALPELRRHGYSAALSTGCLAAGGSLGILIPPSVILVIYAIMVEANIGTLFLAAFVPGFLAAIGYVIAISLYVRLKPEAGPAGPRVPWGERFRSLGDIWSVLVIFVVVIGGIYTGVFTPTEGAAFGTMGTGLLAFTYGRMRWSGFVQCLLDTAWATAMIFLILVGADVLNVFFTLTQMPQEAARYFRESGFDPYVVLVIMLTLYLVLGCLMDSLSMILLTVPVFWPIIAGLEWGMDVELVKIWFGILALIVVEVGLITPPVGMNVFVINSMARDVPMVETFKGVVPFLCSDIARVALLIVFPGITLFLVR